MLYLQVDQLPKSLLELYRIIEGALFKQLELRELVYTVQEYIIVYSPRNNGQSEFVHAGLVEGASRGDCYF